MTQDLRPDDKKAGWEWEVELARHIVGFALVDQDDEEQFIKWKERLGEIDASIGDKYLAKRFAIDRAQQEVDHFKSLAQRYAGKAKKFSRVVDQIKETAVRDMEMHADATGELEIELKDKTRIKLYERISKAVHYNGSPVSETTHVPPTVPDRYVIKKLLICDLKRELPFTEIDGFSLEDKKSSYVRWL
jgi:hypothetical protein